jgi:hypothetical protein
MCRTTSRLQEGAHLSSSMRSRSGSKRRRLGSWTTSSILRRPWNLSRLSASTKPQGWMVRSLYLCMRGCTKSSWRNSSMASRMSKCSWLRHRETGALWCLPDPRRKSAARSIRTSSRGKRSLRHCSPMSIKTIRNSTRKR